MCPSLVVDRYDQGFVKGEEFWFRYFDFYFSYKYSQPNTMERVLLTKSKNKQSPSPYSYMYLDQRRIYKRVTVWFYLADWQKNTNQIS